MNIRKATIEDSLAIFDFIKELAIYENMLDEVKTDVEGIKSSLFGEKSVSKALICEVDQKPVGYAVYFYTYSTWLGKNGIYVEDLYVSKEHRGNGFGKGLLKYIANEAVREKCGRIEWACLDWNTPSREFYKSLGALELNEWVGYRLENESIENLAKN